MVRRSRVPLVVASAALALALVAPGVAAAAPGDLDPSFSGDGYALTTFPGGGGSFYGVALRGSAPTGCGQGGIVLIGVRRPGGGLDGGFSGDGRLRIDPLGGGTSFLESCRYLPDGRLIGVGAARTVGGADRLLVAVFTRDGRPDRRFSGDGFATARFPGWPDVYGYDLAVRGDGRIVVVGETYDDTVSPSSADLAIARFTATGALDRTFGGDGRVTVRFGAGTDGAWRVALDSRGRVVIAGWAEDTVSGSNNTAVVVLRPDGRRDRRFGDEGKLAIDVVDDQDDWANGLALRPDDRIVLGVNDPNGGHAVVQLRRRGGLDLAFGGGDGIVEDVTPTTTLRDLVLQGERIVFAGGDGAGEVVFVRLRKLGGLDGSFGSGGVATLSTFVDARVDDIAIDPRGRIVAAGQEDDRPLLLRLLG
jgi:uncharacterized delta-60 repeat protein